MNESRITQTIHLKKHGGAHSENKKWVCIDKYIISFEGHN